MRILHDRLRKFAAEALRSVGSREDVIAPVVESLVDASLRGIDSHGIELLPHYLRAVKAGRVNPAPQFRFEQTGAGAGRLDADDGFGHAAGAVAIDHAVRMARESGMAAVSVHRSTHYGTAGYFALRAARQDLIGLSFTHADSLTLSHAGTRPFFGTNPIAFAAPCDGEEPFCLDMATSLANWNKVRQYRTRGVALPEGWACDAQGRPTTSAAQAAGLLPIGAYKGFGLAMMVEILCSLLTGMPFGRRLVRMYADPIESKRNLGHFFAAIDIARFVELREFRRRLSEMMAELRSEPAADPASPVQVPGDPEKRVLRDRIATGIPLTPATAETFEGLARTIGFDWPGGAA